MLESFIEVVRAFGPTVAVVAFFLYKDYVREAKMEQRSVADQDFIRERLLERINASNAALQNNTIALKAMISALGTRPCIAREMSMIRESETHADE